MVGDSSYFAEKFFEEAIPVLPPFVHLDKTNRFKCDATLVVVDDVFALRAILNKLPRFPTHRIWCFVNKNTIDELEEIFNKSPSDFGDADVIVLVRGNYEVALRIQQPERVLEKINYPKRGQKWPVIKNYIRAFSGKEIKYSTTNCDIHSHYVESRGGYWGLDWNIFKAISEGMKLKPTLVQVPSPVVDATGIFINGSWKGGILENIDRGIADIGFCGFIFESTKFRGRISMGNPVRETCIIYAVLRPKPKSEAWTLVFYSFTPIVHVLVGVSIIVFAVTIRTVSKTEHFQSKSIAGYKYLSYCLNSAWGLFFQGHFPDPWRMGVLRPFLFLWAMFSVLMASSFSSHLVSNFTSPPYTPKPKTIKDLVKLGYESPQNSHQFPLNKILDPDEPNTHEWLNRIYTVNNHEQMVAVLDKSARQAIFGFKYSEDVFVPYTKEVLPERVLSKYETIDRCIDKIYEGFAFRRGSPFLKPFNEYSLNLMQSGFLQKFTKDILRQVSSLYPAFMKATKTQQSTHTINSLSLFHLQGVFIILLLGHAIATLVLIGEVIYNFELNKYKTAQQQVETRQQIRFLR